MISFICWAPKAWRADLKFIFYQKNFRTRMRRWTALLTCAVFLLTTFFFPAQVRAAVPAETQQVSLPADFSSLHLPSEIGKIDDLFNAQTGGAQVIILQDAHAIPDAQRSIRKAILYFYQKYGVRLVALEGASDKLDARMLKSFPDKERLNKVLGDYFDRGELAGGTAAAISGIKAEDHSAAGTRMIFQGLEDWPVYEEALELYLAAMGKEKAVTDELKVRSEKLEEEKKAQYSKELLKVDVVIRAFRENSSDFIKTLEALAAVKAPEEGSELALLLEQSAKEKQAPEQDSSAEVRELSRQVENYFKTAVSSGKLKGLQNEFQGQKQQFQLSQISAEAFALSLQTIALKAGLRLRVSEKLLGLVRKEKRMADIEGTKLFSDFERYSQSVKEALFENEQARELDRRDRRLWLAVKLAKLEVSYEDWVELEQLRREGVWSVDGLKMNSMETLFESHFAFYRNAQKRDEIFFKNLQGQLRGLKSEGRSAVMVAGGFHAHGLCSLLKKNGVSYALVMPEIKNLPAESRYRAQMRGDFSWKDYFEVENGKVNLYNAFIRGTRDRLLNSRKDKASSAPSTPRDPRLLKNWRDQIIRDLADEGRIDKAGKYTRFIDELTRPERDPGVQKRLAQVDKFLEDLKRLDGQGQFTAPNIAKLFQPATVQTISVVSLQDNVLMPANHLEILSESDSLNDAVLPEIEGTARFEVRSESSANKRNYETTVNGIQIQVSWDSQENRYFLKFPGLVAKSKVERRITMENTREDLSTEAWQRDFVSYQTVAQSVFDKAVELAQDSANDDVSVYVRTVRAAREEIFSDVAAQEARFEGYSERLYPAPKIDENYKSQGKEVSLVGLKGVDRDGVIVDSKQTLKIDYGLALLLKKGTGEGNNLKDLVGYDFFDYTVKILRPLTNAEVIVLIQKLKAADSRKSFEQLAWVLQQAAPENSRFRSGADVLTLEAFIQQQRIKRESAVSVSLSEEAAEIAAAAANTSDADRAGTLTVEQVEAVLAGSDVGLAANVYLPGVGWEPNYLRDNVRQSAQPVPLLESAAGALARLSRASLEMTILDEIENPRDRVPGYEGKDNRFVSLVLTTPVRDDWGRPALSTHTFTIPGSIFSEVKAVLEREPELLYRAIQKRQPTYARSLLEQLAKIPDARPVFLGKMEMLADMTEKPYSDRLHTEKAAQVLSEALGYSFEDQRLKFYQETLGTETLFDRSGFAGDFRRAVNKGNSPYFSELAASLRAPARSEMRTSGEGMALANPAALSRAGKNSIGEIKADVRSNAQQIKVGKISVAVDKRLLLEYLSFGFKTEGEFVEYLSNFLTRRISLTPPASGDVVIAVLDTAETLFEDHQANGFIGIHRSLIEKLGGTPRTARKMLEIGIGHQLSHEARSVERKILTEHLRVSGSLSFAEAVRAAEKFLEDHDGQLKEALVQLGLWEAVEEAALQRDLSEAQSLALDMTRVEASGVLPGSAPFIRHYQEEDRSQHSEFLRDHLEVLDAKFGLVGQDQLVYQEIDEIFQKVKKAAGLEDEDLRLHVINSDEINAYWLNDSGEFFLSLGLIKSFKSYLDGKNDSSSVREGIAWILARDMVSWVLSHEVRHKIQKSLTEEQGEEELNRRDRIDRTQNLEYDADVQGLFIAAFAGFNPNASVTALQFLDELGSIPFLFDHPKADNRLGEVQKVLQSPDQFLPNSQKPLESFSKAFMSDPLIAGKTKGAVFYETAMQKKNLRDVAGMMDGIDDPALFEEFLAYYYFNFVQGLSQAFPQDEKFRRFISFVLVANNLASIIAPFGNTVSTAGQEGRVSYQMDWEMPVDLTRLFQFFTQNNEAGSAQPDGFLGEDPHSLLREEMIKDLEKKIEENLKMLEEVPSRDSERNIAILKVVQSQLRSILNLSLQSDFQRAEKSQPLKRGFLNRKVFTSKAEAEQVIGAQWIVEVTPRMDRSGNVTVVSIDPDALLNNFENFWSYFEESYDRERKRIRQDQADKVRDADDYFGLADWFRKGFGKLELPEMVFELEVDEYEGGFSAERRDQVTRGRADFLKIYTQFLAFQFFLKRVGAFGKSPNGAAAPGIPDAQAINEHLQTMVQARYGAQLSPEAQELVSRIKYGSFFRGHDLSQDDRIEQLMEQLGRDDPASLNAVYQLLLDEPPFFISSMPGSVSSMLNYQDYMEEVQKAFSARYFEVIQKFLQKKALANGLVLKDLTDLLALRIKMKNRLEKQGGERKSFQNTLFFVVRALLKDEPGAIELVIAEVGETGDRTLKQMLLDYFFENHFGKQDFEAKLGVLERLFPFAGKARNELLEKLFNTLDYQAMSDVDKKKFLEKALPFFKNDKDDVFETRSKDKKLHQRLAQDYMRLLVKEGLGFPIMLQQLVNTNAVVTLIDLLVDNKSVWSPMSAVEAREIVRIVKQAKNGFELFQDALGSIALMKRRPGFPVFVRTKKTNTGVYRVGTDGQRHLVNSYAEALGDSSAFSSLLDHLISIDPQKGVFYGLSFDESLMLVAELFSESEERDAMIQRLLDAYKPASSQLGQAVALLMPMKDKGERPALGIPDPFRGGGASPAVADEMIKMLLNFPEYGLQEDPDNIDVDAMVRAAENAVPAALKSKPSIADALRAMRVKLEEYKAGYRAAVEAQRRSRQQHASEHFGWMNSLNAELISFVKRHLIQDNPQFDYFNQRDFGYSYMGDIKAKISWQLYLSRKEYFLDAAVSLEQKLPELLLIFPEQTSLRDNLIDNLMALEEAHVLNRPAKIFHQLGKLGGISYQPFEMFLAERVEVAALSPQQARLLIAVYKRLLPLMHEGSRQIMLGRKIFELEKHVDFGQFRDFDTGLQKILEIFPKYSLARDSVLNEFFNMEGSRTFENLNTLRSHILEEQRLTSDKDKVEDSRRNELWNTFNKLPSREEKSKFILWLLAPKREMPNSMKRLVSANHVNFDSLPELVFSLTQGERDKFFFDSLRGNNGLFDTAGADVAANTRQLESFVDELYGVFFSENEFGTSTDTVHDIFRSVFLNYSPERRIQLFNALLNVFAVPGKQPATRGEKARVFLEQLGVLGVKVGQYLSEQPDLFKDAPDINNELKSLKKDAADFHERAVFQLLQEAELLDDLISVDETRGRASIKKVVELAMRETGKVAGKLMRPSAEKFLDEDIHVFETTMRMLNEKYPDLGLPENMLEDIKEVILDELSFEKEAANTRQFASNLTARKQNASESFSLHVPEIYHASKHVILEELVGGITVADLILLQADTATLSKKEKIKRAALETSLDAETLSIYRQYDLNTILERIAGEFFQQAFSEGFFHADLHYGNAMITPRREIYMIDLGAVGQATPNQRQEMLQFLLALELGDGRWASSLFKRLSGDSLSGKAKAIARIAGAAKIEASLDAKVKQILKILQKEGIKPEKNVTLFLKSLSAVAPVMDSIPLSKLASLANAHLTGFSKVTAAFHLLTRPSKLIAIVKALRSEVRTEDSTPLESSADLRPAADRAELERVVGLRYGRLSADAQKIWDQLPEDYKVQLESGVSDSDVEGFLSANPSIQLPELSFKKLRQAIQRLKLFASRIKAVKRVLSAARSLGFPEAVFLGTGGSKAAFKTGDGRVIRLLNWSSSGDLIIEVPAEYQSEEVTVTENIKDPRIGVRYEMVEIEGKRYYADTGFEVADTHSLLNSVRDQAASEGPMRDLFGELQKSFNQNKVIQLTEASGFLDTSGTVNSAAGNNVGLVRVNGKVYVVAFDYGEATQEEVTEALTRMEQDGPYGVEESYFLKTPLLEGLLNRIPILKDSGTTRPEVRRSEMKFARGSGVETAAFSQALENFSNLLNNPALISGMTADTLSVGRHAYQLTRDAAGSLLVRIVDLGAPENAGLGQEVGALIIDPQNLNDVDIAKQLWMILEAGRSLALPGQTPEDLARRFVQQISIAVRDETASGLSPPAAKAQELKKSAQQKGPTLQEAIAYYQRLRQINEDGQKAQDQLARLSDEERLTLIIQTALGIDRQPTLEERTAFARSEIRVQKVSEVPGMAERLAAMGIRDHYAGFIEITDQARKFMFKAGAFQYATSKGFMNDPGQFGPRTLRGHEANFFRAVGSYLYVVNESIKYPVHESFHHRAGGKTKQPFINRANKNEMDFLEELQAYFGMNILPNGAIDPAYRSELEMALSYDYAATAEGRKKAVLAVQAIRQAEPWVLPAYLNDFLGRVRSVDEIIALGELKTADGKMDVQAVIDIVMPAGFTVEEVQRAKKAGLNPQALALLDLRREALDREYLRDLKNPTAANVQEWANQWAVLRVGYLVGTGSRSEIRLVREWLTNEDSILRKAVEFALRQLGIAPAALEERANVVPDSGPRSELVRPAASQQEAASSRRTAEAQNTGKSEVRITGTPSLSEIKDMRNRLETISTEELLSFMERISAAPEMLQNQEYLREAEALLSAARYRVDPAFTETQMFKAEDGSFLEHGGEDPMRFLLRNFPALEPVYEAVLPKGNESVIASRRGNTSNVTEYAFRAVESTLNIREMEELSGLRVRAIVRLIILLSYSGLMPAVEADRGPGGAMVQALKSAGFQLPDRTKEMTTTAAYWQALSAAMLQQVMARLNFTEKEIQFADALSFEMPIGTRQTSLSEVIRYLSQNKVRELNQYHPNRGQILREQAARLGVPAHSLFDLSLLLASAQYGIMPADLRQLRMEEGRWQLALNLRDEGLTDLADIQETPAETRTENFSRYEAVFQSIEKARHEVQQKGRLNQIQKPLFQNGRLNPEGIVLTHARHGLPTVEANGKLALHPNSYYGEDQALLRSPRDIVEFSWNGVIDQWSSSSVVVMTPLSAVPKENLMNLWYTATSHLGPYELPPGSMILVRDEAVISEELARAIEANQIEVIRYSGTVTADMAAEQVLQDHGYAPMSLGTNFYEGGLGTETTWMDWSQGGADYFADNYLNDTVKQSEEMAQAWNGASSKGTKDYPLGALTLQMENWQKKFARDGLILTSYYSLEQNLAELEKFSEDYKGTFNSLTAAQRQSPAAQRLSAYAHAFFALGKFETSLRKAVNPQNEKYGYEDFMRGVNRELTAREGGRSSSEPSNALVWYVNFLNQKSGLRIDAAKIKGRQDFIKVMMHYAEKAAPDILQVDKIDSRVGTRSEMRKALAPSVETLGEFVAYGKMSPQAFWENVAKKLEQMRSQNMPVEDVTDFLGREVRAFVDSQGTTNAIAQEVAAEFNAVVLEVFAPADDRLEGGAYAVQFTGQENVSYLAAVAKAIAQQLGSDQNTLLIASPDRALRQNFETELNRQGVDGIHRVPVSNMQRVNAGLYLGSAQKKVPVIYDAMGGQFSEGLAGVGTRHDLDSKQVVTDADVALMQLSRTLLQFAAARHVAFADGGKSVNERLKAALVSKMGLLELKDQLPDVFLADGQNNLAVSEKAVFRMLNFVTEMRAKRAVASAA